VEHLDPPLSEKRRKKPLSVAFPGVFLPTKKHKPESRSKGDDLSNAFSKARRTQETSVVHGAVLPAKGLVLRLSTQFVPHEAVLDAFLLERILKGPAVEMRDVAGIRPGTNIHNELNPVLFEELQKPLKRMTGMADGVDGQHRNNPLEKAPFPGLYLQGFFPEKGDKTREGWIGPQRSAGGKAKREQDLYPNSVSKTSKEEKPCTSIKGAQREQGFFRHILEILYLVSFPWKLHWKLSRIHGLSKKGGPLSPRSCSRSTLWHHLREIRSLKPPFGGRRSGTSKIGPEDPRRSGSLSGPQSLEEMQRLREESPLLRKGSFSILLRKAGFTVGRILKSLKNLGASEGGRETEEGCCSEKPTGESKTPSHEKTLKTSKVASPKDLIAIDTSKVTPFLEGCISHSPQRTSSCGGPIPPSI